MKKVEVKWYLRDERNTLKIRGPYKYAETASAVRDELEKRFPDKEWNLQIIKEEICGEIDA